MRTLRLREVDNEVPQLVNSRAGNQSCACLFLQLKILSSVLLELTIQSLFVFDRIVFFQL